MEQMNFEAMYTRLESIAKEIQGETLTLDAVHMLYTEGMNISEKCLAHIDELKRKIEIGKTHG
jgi:exodeoxyribonuclease VII small subunit